MQNLNIWFERKFDFDFPVDLFPMIVERLRGTPVRLKHKLSGLSPELLTKHLDDGWSVIKQAGHLLILEELWLGRIEDFLNGEKHLRPADLKNKKTHEASYDKISVETVLSEFTKQRYMLVDRLYNLSDEQAGLTARHPRLNQPMRLIDSCCFVAEHDDHHLSRMTDLINSN